jgi:hypothetical protein
MKRWGWSLLGGVLIPFCYVMGLAQLETLIAPNRRKAFQTPIAWPRAIYFYFFPPGYVESTFGEFSPILLLFLVVFNVILYTLISYCLLSILAALRKKRPSPNPQ